MIISMKFFGRHRAMSNYPPQSFHPHPTRKKYIMQALSSVSPLKRKRQDSEASSSSSTKRPGVATTPGNPDWPCLDTVHCRPDGRLEIVQKKDGNQFVVDARGYTGEFLPTTSTQQ